MIVSIAAVITATNAEPEAIRVGLGVFVSIAFRLVAALLLVRVAAALVVSMAGELAKAMETWDARARNRYARNRLFPGREPRYYWPCGQLDYMTRPCMLPRGHTCTEHGTAWLGDGSRFEERHRWDSSTIGEGRIERRYAAGFIGTVTAQGERVPGTVRQPTK